MTPAPPLAPLSVLSDTQIFTAMVGSENSERADRRGINLNVQHKRSMKTMADFKLRSGVMPIRHMDTSDVAEIKHEKTIKKANFNQESKALALASNRNFPPHLLLASLLEELCFIYVKDRNKAQHLFKILCERLSNLQVMAPLSHLDEMSGLRYQRRIMLNKLIRAAMKSMEQNCEFLFGTEEVPNAVVIYTSVDQCSLTVCQSSRILSPSMERRGHQTLVQDRRSRDT